jgi:hypothetical protein
MTRCSDICGGSATHIHYQHTLNNIQAGFAAFTAVMVAAGEAGQGKHQWNVSVAGMQRIALVWW